MRDLPSLVLALAIAALIPLLLVLAGYFVVYLAGESEIKVSIPARESREISPPPEATESLSLWCRTIWSMHQRQTDAETAMFAWIQRTGEHVLAALQALAVYTLVLSGGLFYVYVRLRRIKRQHPHVLEPDRPGR